MGAERKYESELNKNTAKLSRKKKKDSNLAWQGNCIEGFEPSWSHQKPLEFLCDFETSSIFHKLVSFPRFSVSLDNN